MIFRFYFHFKLLPALENKRERERERERESIATSSSADITGWCDSADRNQSFARSREASTTPIAISPIVCPNLMIFFFWVLFVFWEINDIIYLFGNWENVSNKEKMIFLWYFQEHNQTSENIFWNIFWNATKHMKTFSFPKNSISGKYSIFRKYFYTNQTQAKCCHYLPSIWCCNLPICLCPIKGSEEI